MSIYSSRAQSLERREEFNRWVADTDRALRLPGVQQQLGKLGAQLLELNNEAFLPDVRNSTVSVPGKFAQTNRVAILPKLASDGQLRPDKSLLWPSPARQEKMKTGLRQVGRIVSPNAITGLMQHAINKMPKKESTERLLNPSEASGDAFSHYYENMNLLVTSRPAVTFNTEALPHHPILRGAIGAHELVHAIDAETLQGEDDIYYTALTELRAYHVGILIAKAAVKADKLNFMVYGQGPAPELEAIRQTYGINTEQLLGDDLKFIEGDPKHESIVMQIMISGAIGGY